MIVAIIQMKEVANVNKALIKEGIKATRMATVGAFLKGRNETFLIGSNDEKVPGTIEVIEGAISKKSRVKIVATEDGQFDHANSLKGHGGATIFVLNVEQFLKV